MGAAAEPLRILGIAPYEGMLDAMRRTAENLPDVELDVYTGDLQQGADIVRRTVDAGYDAIISRGGTATLIRETTDLPVISIQLSVYDVLRTIRLAQSYSNLYAIVGFPDITEAAHTLCDLLRYELDILTVHSAEEVETTLQRLQQGGYRMVIGDMVTHTIARRMGFDAFLITSGAESLHTALEQAVEQGRNSRRMRRENQLLRRIAQPEKGFVVVLRADGTYYYAAPREPDHELDALLHARMREIPRTGALHFYHWAGGLLYRISAERLTLNREEMFLFRCNPSQIPLRSERTGIRTLNQAECSQLFMSSFYSISGAMGELEPRLNAIAETRQPIMIVGETGTGKQQIARALYLRGSRRNEPFVEVDCALADEKSWDFLLNHAASPLNDMGGTVYFQHLDALSDRRAATLLSQIIETDLARRERLIFSCSCAEGLPLSPTGQDFVNRVGCLSLRLPALRTRADEIPSLASLYLGSLNQELGRELIGFTPHATELLIRYRWPNNYTQFKQVLLELATLATSSYIRGSSVAELLDKQRALCAPGTPAGGADHRTLDQITLDAVRAAVAANNGNHSAAARQLGVSRSTLWRLLKNVEKPPTFDL